MPISSTEIQRLAFIKYLHQLGNEQAKLPEPLSSVAILTYHDSVELFLQLITDSLGVNKSNEKMNFLDYWNLLQNDANNSYKIPYKNEMSRLNKIRVQLKHHGVIPSKQAIDEIKAISSLFFEENTRQIYKIDYSEISLVNLVTFEKTKKALKKAEGEIKSKNFITAIQEISRAFYYLTEDYEMRKVTVNRSPFYFGGSLYEINRAGCRMEENKLSENEIELYRYIETIYQAFQELTSALKIIALGIDYRKYSKFALIAPELDRMKVIHWNPEKELEHISEEDVKFCFNFVIECSLKLSEFDYDLKREKIKTLDHWATNTNNKGINSELSNE